MELPNKCYTLLPSTGELIIIKNGYYLSSHQSGTREANQEMADELNQALGVNKEQVTKMTLMSMNVWDV